MIELDGFPHPIQTVRDEARAEDLKLPLIRFDNQAVLSERFVAWLLRNIREKAEASRVSDAEYARFLRRKREGYAAADRAVSR